MSELRRVSLQPASHTDRFGMGEPPGSTKPAVKKKKRLTMRFNLDLGNPADGECHEFNYIELVRNFKRGKTEVTQEADDPFDSDDDVAAIAKQMEEKYGSGKVAWDDDVDKGQGYDEDDSFIDNREAYDELVPLDLNTKHGGFYINTGDLEFVHAPPVQYMQYHQNDVNKTKATLEESPEEESEEESEREPSPKPSKVDKIKIKRKRKKIDSEDSKDKDQGSGEKRKKLLKKKARKIESSSEEEEEEKEPKEQLDKKELEKKEKLSMKQERQLDDAIEAVVRHARALNKKEVEEEETEVLRLQEEEMEREERENERKRKEKEKSERLEREKHKVTEKEREKVDLRLESPEPGSMRLPDRMPSELEAMVKDITKVAKEGLGKSKFFLANGVSERLLSIDMMARQSLPCSQRTQLYCYLAAHLPCSKETLLKKVKKLRLDEEDSKVKEPMTRFKNELNQMVFDQVEKYRRKCEEIGQKPCGISDSEGEDDIQIHRQFEWTENLRKLFREVVLLKLKTYEVSKLRATSAEEYVKNFFEIDMVKLWPRGWMNSRVLLRMIREDNLLPRARNDGTPNQVKKLGQLQNLGSASVNETPTSTPASTATTPQSTPYRPRLNSVSSVEIPLKDSSFKDSLQLEMTPPLPVTSVIKEKIKQESPITPLHPQREHRESGASMQSVISETGALNSSKEERLLTPPPSEPTETPVHLSVITSSPAKQYHAPTSLPQVETPVFGDSFVSNASPSAPSKKHSATPLLKANYQAALQKSPPYTASAFQAQAFAEFSQKASPTTSVVNFPQSAHKSSSHQTTSSTPAHSSSQYSSPANSIAPTSSYQQKYTSQAAQLQPAHQSSAYPQTSSHSAASYFGSQNSQSQNSREKEPLLAADVFDRIITQQLAISTHPGNSVNAGSQNAYNQQASSYQSNAMLSTPSSHRSSSQSQQQTQQQQQQKNTQLPRATMPSSYKVYEAFQQQPQQPKSREQKMSYSQSQQHSSMVANAQMFQQLHSQQAHQPQQQQRNTSNLEGMKGFPSPMSSTSSVPSYYTSSAAASAYQQQGSQVPQVAHSSPITSTSNRYSTWNSHSGMYPAHQQRQYYQQQPQHQQDPRRLLLQQQQQQHQQQQQQDLHRQH